MDQGPLVNERVEAGEKFLAEFDKYAPVKAAFWISDPDAADWNLCVASDQINDTNFVPVYGEILRITDALNDPHLEPERVKLIWPDDRMIQDALDLQRRYPGKAMRFNRRIFGNQSVDGVYIYPPLHAPFSPAASGPATAKP